MRLFSGARQVGLRLARAKLWITDFRPRPGIGEVNLGPTALFNRGGVCPIYPGRSDHE